VSVVALHPGPAVPLTQATQAFLAGYERIESVNTRRNYASTLAQLAARFGGDTIVTAFDAPAAAEGLRAWFRERYGPLKPATYCRNLAVLQSAFGWWQLQGWCTTDPTATLQRRTIRRDGTRALPAAEIEGIRRRKNVALRDRTLWLLLYETAARASEALSLNIEDLDLPNKKARVVGKGQKPRWVYWQTGAALLLPRLIAGRERGPLFLADRRPNRAVATLDLCPDTGRGRLSYRRAEEIFNEATGYTFHQLRHSRLTHEAEAGTNNAMLMAISGHSSLRSLDPYTRPGPDAVARHVARNDPARRRQ
jgi:integrase